MGNTGSAHNLHSEYVDSELNSYFSQQYLKRTTGDAKKKCNQAGLGGWPGAKNVADCKVLPKPTENLKLRATTNGAILQAGGTISFRAKEQLDVRTGIPVLGREKEANKLQPMRRCHTLILDSKNESISHRKSDTPQSEFRRSQTLLHVGYNCTKSQENITKNFDDHIKRSSQPPNTSTTSTTLKVNKYNKKRKAPPAPTKFSSGVNLANVEDNLSSESKSIPAAKPRIYATNTNKTSVPHQQQQNRKQELQTSTVTYFQRSSNIRTSINSRPFNQSNSGYISKLPYRREKSFDAVLLRQKENSDWHNRKESTQKKNVEEKIRQEETNISCNLRTKDYKNENQSSESQSVATKEKVKHQQSRIPQLKRTFYFGMEASKPTNLHKSQKTQNNECSNVENIEENEDIILLNHNIEAEEEIVDNGILVHVRPTLPRRQPETPSFSPAAAWRNLLEEQQRLLHERTKPKQRTLNKQIIESPICLSTTANWTPQQDLEDDDDDYEGEDEVQQKCKATKLSDKIEKAPEKLKNSNSLHIFSLSLPRDVHLQCQMKTSQDCVEQDNGLKAVNCWLVPGFNSLQKFKTHLSKNVETRSNNKCTCAAKTTNKRNSYHTQTIFGDSFSSEPKSHHPDCEIYKTSSRPPSYSNDNWLLHKSKANDTSLSAVSKTAGDPFLKNSLNSHSLADLQPKSLTNICGGKHIVYLPGQNAFNDLNKSPKQAKATKTTFKRQRQRQELVRESLQDLTPIQNIHQSNVDMSEKNTHRFSFQSTVRVLEKRRLAEKLSKDAEIQEAQRLHELEAMKRVEEDFQRKRAPEKANLRNQLRLHLKASTENEEYRSLPLNINHRYDNQHLQNQHPSDVNNNLYCRAEPDGAVSPNLDFNDNPDKMKHSNFPLLPTKGSKELERFDSDCEESGSEIQMPDLQCTALLIEPYLHSII